MRLGRTIAGRKTHQTRSYFALKLPGGWWLWATDSQLSGYIDQPQIDYFRFAAAHWMEPGANVILCVGVPSWTHVDCKSPGETFGTLSYLERLAGIARNTAGEPMGHRLRLVLAGDSHHYARYRSAGIEYITCGGGGAFLHPTHHLEDKCFDWTYPPPGVAAEPGCAPYRRVFTVADKESGEGKALFPDAETSKSLACRNLAFAWINPKFTLALAGAYLIFNWLINSICEARGMGPLAKALAPDFLTAVHVYVSLIFASPAPVTLLGAGFGVCYYLADSRSTLGRLTKSAIHTTAHIVLAGLVAIAAIRQTAAWWAWSEPFAPGPILSLASTAILAAAASGTFLGAYFLFNLKLWGLHWNEAFSALRIPDFKCFLRISIDRQGDLRIYPVGLRKVPSAHEQKAGLKPHLIEGPLLIKV